MKGKITIDVLGKGAYALDVVIDGFTHMDRLMTVDALVEAMGFTEDERLELGTLIAIGGFKSAHKDAMTKMVLSDVVTELIRKRKGNEK